MGNMKFEKWIWNQDVSDINHPHRYNSIVTADMFQEYCDNNVKYKLFGVGEKHHNDKSERYIQTIMNMAGIFMLHVSLHWELHLVD